MNKMNDWRKLALLLGGAVLAVPASAQTPTDTTQPSAADESGLGDIVVTAQKREENLQRVPITVSAFNNDMLAAASVGSARDLSTVVPGLVFNRSVGSGTPFLRGVGQSAGAIGVEPTVALYMDGIYFPTSGAIVASLNSVEQIAVLKGPQGTLFGRNSTGGVIQVTTRTPGNTPALDADVGYANYDTISGHLYASTPVGDTLRTSIAIGGFNQIEGWGRNIFLNKDYYDAKEFTAQSKSVLDVGEDTSLTFNLLYIYTRGYVGNGYGVFPGSLGSDGVTRYLGEYTFAAGNDQDRVARHYVGSLTFEHDFGWAKYKGQVATQKFKDDLIVVQNGLPLNNLPPSPATSAFSVPLHNHAKPTTAEIQLQSPDSSSIRWIVGAFYLRETSGTRYDAVFNRTRFSSQVSEQKSRSYAAFSEVSAEILPDTRLTLGGRYTIDKKSLDATSVSALTGAVTTYAGLVALPQNTANGWATEKTWKRPTWRVALDHQLTPDIMLFGSYNRGFKSGIYNLITLNQKHADPEKIDAYELGTKMMLFDRRLRLNIAGFYYKYSNLQLRATIAGTNIIALLNAAKAEIKGVDVDFQAKVTDGLEFTGGFEILDGKYTSFPQGPCTEPRVTPPGGLRNFTCDLSDRRMARSPKFTGNLGLQYTLPLASGNELQWNVNDNYNSGYNWEPDGRLKQKSYHSLSAAVKFSMQDGKYYARVWGANLADEKIRALVGYAANDVYAPGAPRTYGITIGCKCLD